MSYSATASSSNSDQMIKHSPTVVETPLLAGDNDDSASAEQTYFPTVTERETPVELAAFNSRESHDLAFLQEIADLPQGRHLGIFAVIVNFVSRILGSGIFASPALVYKDVGGSPFLFFVVWFASYLLAFSGLYVYLELGSLVSKNGGTKSFLEFIYYKPKLLTSVIIGICSVLFGWVVSNALVFGEYFLYSFGITFSKDSALPNYVALALIFISFFIHSLSVKNGAFIQNVLGTLKLILLLAIACAGFYALLPPKITSIENQLKGQSFFAPKTEVTIAGFTSALFKGVFTMSGWNSMHTLAGEISDPIRTMKIAGPLSLVVICVCYFFINLAYLIVIPYEELIDTGELVGSLLFEKLFGVNIGRIALTLSVALSAGGNVFVVMYSCARMNQEVFREGFLPMSKTLASNSRFGTPVYSMLICVAISTIFLAVPSKGGLYNFIVNLETYPGQVFIAMVAAGIFIVRKRYPDIRAPIRCSLVAPALVIFFTILVVIGPFFPTKGSINNDGYPNYALTTCALFAVAGAFWYIKFILLPWWGSYELAKTEVVLDDGLTVKQWNKVYR